MKYTRSGAWAGTLTALVPVALLSTTACTGRIGDALAPMPGSPAPPPSSPAPGGTGGSGIGTPTPVAPVPAPTLPPASGPAAACQESAPAVSPLRRLTRDQYTSTVRDLLGDARSFAVELPEDDQGDEVFDPPGALIVTPSWAEGSMKGAEVAAKLAVAKLPALLPCQAQAGEPCARQFIESFGKRAFRRPLQAAEVTGLLNVYRVGAGSGGFPRGVELVVQALLQSPSFLYRVELGDGAGAGAGPGTVKLTQHEVAARLSYMLWGTMPDTALLAAADAGKLAGAESITAQARRMLAEPAARASVVAFSQRWLGIGGIDELTKDPARYPMWKPALIASMKAELSALLGALIFEGDGRLETLLTSPTAFVDANLAPLYGVPAPAGATPARVALDPTRRAGFLTSVGVLSAHTFSDSVAAIHRGKFVRERLLCTTPPNPPADLNVVAPEPPPNVSNREALAAHSTSPACSACHELMDPIGLGFESYDGVGRWRATDGGKPVDDSGRMTKTMDIDGPFRGVVELSRKLAGSAQVRACVIDTVVGYAQAPQVAQDVCVRSKLTAAFDAAKHDLRELLIAVTATDGFQYRRALPGEVLP